MRQRRTAVFVLGDRLIRYGPVTITRRICSSWADLFFAEIKFFSL